MKVLVTGAGAVLGQGIIKCLRMAAGPYEIVAADPDPRAVGLYWADKAYLIPMAKDPDYLARVQEVLALERPDALLIGTDVELCKFAENRAELEATYQVKVIVSPPDVIKIADDKWLTYQFLRRNGFPYPQSALPDQIGDLLQTCGFPLIVKPRVSARSVGVHLVHNERELDRALTEVSKPIVQEAVATSQDEYTSGVVLGDGCVQAVVTMRRDLRDGNTYRAYVEPDSTYDGLLARIADTLSGVGPLNFQFRVAQGVPKIFEINARFSGTTPFRAYAGFNEVDAIVRHAVYGDPITRPKLAPVIVLRYLNEMVVTARELHEMSKNSQQITGEIKGDSAAARADNGF
jgi:carbamoyl-phosphate synthase large subunit